MDKKSNTARRAMKELFSAESAEEFAAEEIHNEKTKASAQVRRPMQQPMQSVKSMAGAQVRKAAAPVRSTENVKSAAHGGKFNLFAAPAAANTVTTERTVDTFNREMTAVQSDAPHKSKSPRTHKKVSIKSVLIAAACMILVAAGITCTVLFVNAHDITEGLPDIQLGADIALSSDSLIKIAEAIEDGDSAAAAKYTEKPEYPETAAETDAEGDIIYAGEASQMLAAHGLGNAASEGRYNVTINFYQKESITLTTASITYAELFEKAGVTISESERIYVEPSDYITANIIIAVDTVEYRTVSENEAIPYDTEYEDIRTIARGTTSLKRAGVNGTKQIDYYCEYVNGIEMTRTEVSETVVKNPTSRVYYRGIGGTIGGRSYSYYIDVKATTYTGGGTTASGLPATENVIAVDPRVIPLGTKCYVTGSYGDFGVRVAADTGGSIKGNLIDIYLNQSNPYFGGFGWRKMRVYILG